MLRSVEPFWRSYRENFHILQASALVEERDQKPQRRTFSNLDFIRSLAVLAVVLAHARILPLMWNASLQEQTNLGWHFGQLGVLAFFVLTSLVLMWSLERENAGSVREGCASNFYIRRAWRIYPLAIAAIAFGIFFPVLSDVSATDKWGGWDVLTNITLTQNLFHSHFFSAVLWTLPVEVQMYVMLPCLFLFLRKRSVSWTLLLCAISIPVALFVDRYAGRLNVLSYCPVFFGGILAWRIMREKLTQRLPGWILFAVLPCVALVWMATPRQSQEVSMWAFGILLGLSIPWFREIPGVWLRDASATVAKYSYGIYISHCPIMRFSFGLHVPFAVQVAVCAVLLAIVPVAFYYLLEEPGIRAGRRVVQWRRDRKIRTFTVGEPVLRPVPTGVTGVAAWAAGGARSSAALRSPLQAQEPVSTSAS